jgi:tape measure domain-containing protein
MADLSLKIKANSDQAIAAFKALANASEYTAEKMARFTEKFKADSVDKFIDKQKLAGAAITATRGPLAAMEAQHAAYGREIERLIKAGLSPESEHIKRLQSEYTSLSGKINEASAGNKAYEASTGGVNASLQNMANAIHVAKAAAGMLKQSFDFFVNAASSVEDMTAAYTPLMGTAEKAAGLVKNIQIEAAKTPFEISSIGDSVKTLLPAFKGSEKAAMNAFRMIGDTAQGNAQKLNSITTAYTKVMLKGKVSMEELNMISNAGVPIYDELAKSMGVSTAQMMEMSSKGGITADDLTSAFQRMTSEGGMFFKGMEVSSTTFSATLLGVKENANIAASMIGQELLPAAQEVAQAAYDATRGFIDWIDTGDNLESLISGAKIAMVGLTAATTAFVIASKGSSIVQAMAVAINALKASMFPAGVIAAAVAGIAVAVTAFAEASRRAAHSGETLAKGMKEQREKASGLLTEYEGLSAERRKEFDLGTKLLAVYPELAGKIDVTTASYEELKAALKKVNEEKGKEAMDEAAKWQGKIVDAAVGMNQYLGLQNKFIAENQSNYERAKKMAEEDPYSSWAGQEIMAYEQSLRGFRLTIDAYHKDIDKYKAQANAALSAVGKTLDASGAIVPIKIEPEGEEETDKKIKKIVEQAEKTLSDRLNDIQFSPAAAFNNQVGEIASFLEKRAEMEKVAGEQRLEWYETEARAMIQKSKLTASERLAAEEAINVLIFESREGLNTLLDNDDAKTKAALEERLKLMGQTDVQVQQERTNTLAQFLQARFEAEESARVRELEAQQEHDALAKESAKMSAEEKITFLREQAELIKKDAQLDAAEATALAQWVADKELAIKKEEKEAEDKLNRERATSAANLFGALAGLADKGAEHNRGLAITAKALSAAQAGINSYLAFTKTLADGGPYPLNIVNAAAALASGLAQQVAIWSTPIPSAETGGRFIVPDVSPRVDSAMMRLNPGETVDVTPRGESGGGSQRITVMLDRQPLFDVINDGIRSGDIILSLANV